MHLLKSALLILLLPVYIYADIDAIAQKIQDDFDGQNIDLFWKALFKLLIQNRMLYVQGNL